MRNADINNAEATANEQLVLLSVEPDTRARELPTTANRRRDVHARFRLNKQTRERGLRHVAEIRKQLDDARREQAADTQHAGAPGRAAA